jgi:hypothetical protein
MQWCIGSKTTVPGATTKIMLGYTYWPDKDFSIAKWFHLQKKILISIKQQLLETI